MGQKFLVTEDDTVLTFLVMEGRFPKWRHLNRKVRRKQARIWEVTKCPTLLVRKDKVESVRE